MNLKYPRPDIKDYLTTEKLGAWPPDHLHYKKPVYDGEKYICQEDEEVVDIRALFVELGLIGKEVPMPLFLSICENLLQLHEAKVSKDGKPV